MSKRYLGVPIDDHDHEIALELLQHSLRGQEDAYELEPEIAECAAYMWSGIVQMQNSNCPIIVSFTKAEDNPETTVYENVSVVE